MGNHIRRINVLGKARCAPYSDWRGSRMLRHEDLTGWGLIGADLRGADLSKCTGSQVDLRCADLRGANLEGAVMDHWDLTGANLERANLAGAEVGFHTWMRGANLERVTFDQTRFLPNGWRTLGLQLPGVNPRDLVEAYDNNILLALCIRHTFDGDPEMTEVARYCVAEPHLNTQPLPCWEGFVSWIRERHPARIPDLWSMADENPAWHMRERWALAESILNGQDGEDLRKHPHHDMFEGLITRRIRAQREAARVTA